MHGKFDFEVDYHIRYSVLCTILFNPLLMKNIQILFVIINNIVTVIISTITKAVNENIY